MEREKNPLYDVAVCELHGRQNNFYDEDGTIKCAGCFPIIWEWEICLESSQAAKPPTAGLGLSTDGKFR